MSDPAPTRLVPPHSAGEPGPDPAKRTGPAGDGTADSDRAARSIDRSLPPDPAAYDSERASLARARGLSAPYIAGGRDPEPDAGQREERLYGRLLVVMVVIIVLGGFALGILGNLITALRGS
jgi:hypothetical protein